MGWQGRMRDAKGRRYFAKLIAPNKDAMRFREAYAWRDDSHVWLFFHNRASIRMNRKTGCVEGLNSGAGSI